MRGAGLIALGVLGLVLAGRPAAAQTGPSAEARQAAGRELTLPTGVGGCVMHAMNAQTRGAILAVYASGKRGVPPELPKATAPVAQFCTGRPYSASDSALVAAVIGALQRTGVAVYFAAEQAIGQHRLDAVWAEASAEEKAPFLKAGQAMADPKATPIAPTAEQTIPFARRLALNSTNVRLLDPVQQYYLATAMRDAGEARLAAEGAKPAPP